MKKLIFSFLFSAVAIFCFGQETGFKYQAVLRDANTNVVMPNQSITLIFNVYDLVGNLMFSEFHQTTSNELGVVDLTIGTGENDGPYIQDVDWGKGPLTFQISGTTDDGKQFNGSERLGGVPYAYSVPNNSITLEKLDLVDLRKEREEWWGGFFKNEIEDDDQESWEEAFSYFVQRTVELELIGIKAIVDGISDVVDGLNDRFVNEEQPNSVETDMIQDNSLTPIKMSEETEQWIWESILQGPFIPNDQGILIGPDGRVLIGTGDPHDATTFTVQADNQYGTVSKGDEIGMAGIATAETGSTLGVFAKTYSGEGDALEAYNESTGAHCNLAGNNYALWASNGGDNTVWGAWVSGAVNITGSLTKAAGAFRIDHPLDPANKYLNHSFVESPDMKNIYDGVALLDNNGEAVVNLPEWFEALNKDFRYQLTCIGGFANVYIAEKIQDNQFKIAGGSPKLEVSWQVTGIRKDAYANENRIEVEVLKDGNEAGKYLHPEVFGVSKTLGIRFEEHQEIARKSLTIDKQNIGIDNF